MVVGGVRVVRVEGWEIRHNSYLREPFIQTHVVKITVDISNVVYIHLVSKVMYIVLVKKVM